MGKPKRTAVSARLGWSRLGILVRMEEISRTCSVSSGLLCWAIHFWILVALYAVGSAAGVKALVGWRTVVGVVCEEAAMLLER